MSTPLNRSVFEPLVGQLFHAEVPGQPAQEWTLTQVESFAGEGFGLLLSGPAQNWLSQGIVRLTQPTLGTLELFSVPLGTDAHGMRYQIIFN